MIFKKKRKFETILPSLKLNNVELEKVKTIKYLGLILDENLTWDSHINALNKSIAPYCGILWKLSKFVPKKAL